MKLGLYRYYTRRNNNLRSFLSIKRNTVWFMRVLFSIELFLEQGPFCLNYHCIDISEFRHVTCTTINTVFT